MKKNLTILIGIILILVVILIAKNSALDLGAKGTGKTDTGNLSDMHDVVQGTKNPLSIASLRAGSYPGSEIKIEEALPAGSNYDRYIASYQSEGNKIYALLTVPIGQRPTSGWPVVIFNHGFIPPSEYRTTERYIAYTDAFSRNGYIVFRSDYRGHGSSEGVATGGYGSNGYTIDVLNAVASVKRLKPSVISNAVRDPQGISLRQPAVRNDNEQIVDANRMGMWGHSMGGHITLRNMVINKDIKAGVIWGGVVASYPDLINNWRRSPSGTPQPAPSGARRWRQVLVDQYGEPSGMHLRR